MKKMAEEAVAVAAENVNVAAAPEEPKKPAVRVKPLPRPDREAFDAEMAQHQALVAANHNRIVRSLRLTNGHFS